jgi:chemotaxis protein CheX
VASLTDSGAERLNLTARELASRSGLGDREAIGPGQRSSPGQLRRRLQERTMNVDYINPFLEGTINVLKTMARVEARPGKPFLKKDNTAAGDVTGIIGVTGATEGSLAVTFTQSCILHIVSCMLGEQFDKISAEIKDAVGELTNMISGDARRVLGEKGVSLEASIPTVVSGPGHSVDHISNSPTIVIPFSTDHGNFTVEVCFVK